MEEQGTAIHGKLAAGSRAGTVMIRIRRTVVTSGSLSREVASDAF
jgi:hypothetical protein